MVRTEGQIQDEKLQDSQLTDGIIRSGRNRDSMDNVQTKGDQMKDSTNDFVLKHGTCQNFGPIHYVPKSFDIAQVQRFLPLPLKGQNVTFEKSRVTHSTTFAFFGAKAVHSFQPKIGHHQGFVPRKLRFYTIKLLSIEKHNFDMGIK